MLTELGLGINTRLEERGFTLDSQPVSHRGAKTALLFLNWSKIVL